jgi:glycosyltransferase involved in cell wall biosynthesis
MTSYKLLFLDQFGTLGGGQRVLLETLNSLDPMQYKTMVALGTGGEFRETLLANGIPVVDLPLGQYHSMQKTLRDKVRFFFRSLYCSFVLTRWILRHRPHLLFANAPRAFICAALAGWFTRRPVIWHLHNVLPQGIELSLLVVFARWVHTIVVCSRAAARPLLSRSAALQSKVRLVYNPVSLLRQPPRSVIQELRERFGVSVGDLSFGIFGRITPFKGQWHFLQAARIVGEQTHRAQFFIVGSPAEDERDQEYYNELRRNLEPSELKMRVHFIEHRRDVERYLAMVDVVVVASQGPEALPQTIMEAMSLGKAIIAPGNGGIVELLEDGKTGMFADVSEPGQLAAAMLRLIHDADTRQTLGRNAQARMSQRDSRVSFAEEIQFTLQDCLSPSRAVKRIPVSPEAVPTKGAIP